MEKMVWKMLIELLEVSKKQCTFYYHAIDYDYINDV